MQIKAMFDRVLVLPINNKIVNEEGVCVCVGGGGVVASF